MGIRSLDRTAGDFGSLQPKVALAGCTVHQLAEGQGPTEHRSGSAPDQTPNVSNTTDRELSLNNRRKTHFLDAKRPHDCAEEKDGIGAGQEWAALTHDLSEEEKEGVGSAIELSALAHDSSGEEERHTAKL